MVNDGERVDSEVSLCVAVSHNTQHKHEATLAREVQENETNIF